MKKIEAYIDKLKSLESWNEYLMEESGLPGPRGNLELLQAVVEAGGEERYLELLKYTPDKAPVNSKEEFLSACGTAGLGKLVVEGKKEYLKLLKNLASDPRWRTREAVAIALQRYGEESMEELIDEMQIWSQGSYYEMRAAAAALCEPKLLHNRKQVFSVLQILDSITESIVRAVNRKDEGFTALRKGMGYCWSVAIAWNFEEGRKLFEKWLDSDDRDVKWVVRENLKKNRLIKNDEQWVLDCIKRNN